MSEIEHLQKIAPSTFLLPKTGLMKVPGLIVAPEKLLQDLQEPLKQVQNVATLPGIAGFSISMPDIHWGYGFPIGGVAATDYETGVISPGGVGYDINCGVRLALVDLPFSSLSDSMKQQLLQTLYDLIPSGIGESQKKKPPLSNSDYDALLTQGSIWSIQQGFGHLEDLQRTESFGVLPKADASLVSNTAKNRGRNQLGTIGSGNHFVEIGRVEKIFSDEVAKAWGLKLGQTYILIHSGSRGLGHQVCQDTLEEFMQQGLADNLIDPQLVAAPLQSSLGQHYLKAMSAAANFAFNNRQQILHQTRLAFQKVCNIPPEEIPLLYDVCHNIAKIENHLIQGKETKVCVHRKGATRALGPHDPELPPLYRKTGQPVLVPGDMQRASYIMVGLGNPVTFCSACHGAGRAKSRVKSLQSWQGKDPIHHMETLGVLVKASSKRTIAEEMPDAYKDASDVVEAVEEAKLASKVAILKPHLVLKG